MKIFSYASGPSVSRHDYFCVGKSCLILMMKMSLSQANHSTGISKGYIDVGINPIDEDVPI